MTARLTDDIKRLIEEADTALEKLESTDGQGSILLTPTRETVEREILSRELRQIDEEVQPSADGQISLTVSEDEMMALLTLTPPTGDGRPVLREDIEQRLQEAGVVHGILWEAVVDAVEMCNGARQKTPDIVVARGSLAQDGMAPFLMIEPSLKEKKPEYDEAARLDHKERSPYTLVSRGAVLARLQHGSEGRFGRTVRGVEIPFKTTTVESPKPGRNTEASGDAIVAALDGRFILQTGSFWINEVLQVKGDVDYSTGHLNFPGDIIISGDIKHGFNVRSGGSIYCGGVIDASRIECAGDLETPKGIIGRKSGIVRCGGSVKAKYIESCYVEARGSIQVQTGCLNAMLYTLDRFTTGPRGIVVGGKIYAQNGVEINQVGTNAGPRTEIHCGIDYSIEAKLTWIRDRNIELAMKLSQIERKLKAGVSNSALPPLRDRIRAAIHTLNETAKSLVGSLDKNEKATVTVLGSIVHGSYMEICHVPNLVTSPMRCVRFFLDKAKGKVGVEKIVVK